MDNESELEAFPREDANSPEMAVISSKPAPVHVPPRIDPDFYQADVPDWCPPTDGEFKVA